MSKKYPSTEEVEHKHGDRLEGSVNPPEPKQSPEEPWDTPEFHDQVRAAGFPVSYFGDAAFMAACWKLTGGAPPP